MARKQDKGDLPHRWVCRDSLKKDGMGIVELLAAQRFYVCRSPLLGIHSRSVGYAIKKVLERIVDGELERSFFLQSG